MTTPNLLKTEEMETLSVEEDLLCGADTLEREWRMYYDIASPAPAYADIMYPPTTGFTIVGNPVPVRGVADNGVLYPTKRKARRDPDDERIWILSVSYVNPKPTDKKDQPPGSTKYNVKISMNSEKYEETTHIDNAGKVILNCVKEPLDPPLTRVKSDSSWNISYHVAAPDWATLNACKDNANNANITLTINGSNKTFANGTLKLDAYGFDADVDSNGTAVCNVNLTLLERVDGWATKFAQKSFCMYGSDGKIRRIKYDDVPNPPTDSNATLKGQYVETGAIFECQRDGGVGGPAATSHSDRPILSPSSASPLYSPRSGHNGEDIQRQQGRRFHR